MIDFIYVEEEILDHPRTQFILGRLPKAKVVYCKKYSEIFNRKAQNFRLQKENPALILAKKYGNLLLPIPPSYGIGRLQNYYFSHLLNCPFDCSYCFLQGMYRSAHYVLFVNYEDFQTAILNIVQKNSNQKTTIFSGYDGDSLALETITHFAKDFLPFFKNNCEIELELRTKSIQIASLLSSPSIENCIIAFSLNPKPVIETFEKNTPSLYLRLNAIQKLQKAGWQIGLRFDPVIYHMGFEENYRSLFYDVFSKINKEFLHSVTLGSFRLPKTIFRNMVELMPQNKLLAFCSLEQNEMVSFPSSFELPLMTFCKEELLKYIPENKLFLSKSI
jgi:spore photoproduct lyase